MDDSKMNTSLQTILLAPVLFMNSHTVLQAADDKANHWYFSPMLSYIQADSGRRADDGFGELLGFGKPFGDHWNIELSAAFDNLDFESGLGEYKQSGLMLDGLYVFDRKTTMQTYAIVGVGGMLTDIGATDSVNAMFNVGAGIMRQITDGGIKFRADVRYRMEMDDSSVISETEFNDLMLNIGLTIPFGGMTKPSLTKTEQADSDNDGVLDSHDQCPTSVPGEGIDINGCELQQSFVLKGVNFVTGSDVLTTNAKYVLDEVATTLIKNSVFMVQVAGYTDDRGEADANLQLSQERAESVKAYLESVGVDGNQLSARGFGEENPDADNTSSQGRMQNRRVELHILTNVITNENNMRIGGLSQF